MKREKLESYQSMLAEIVELSSKLENLKDDETLINADTVLDYRTGQGITRKIVGVDQNRYWRKRQQYIKRIEKLQADCDLVEEWVDQIPDSETRRMFRMIYMDGMSQKEVGSILHLDRSGVSRKISFYLKQHNTE